MIFQDMKAEKRQEERNREIAAKSGAKTQVTVAVKPEAPRKLTYKEKKELEELDKTIAALSEEKAALEALLAGGTADYEEITRASARFSEIKEELDLAELRWLELSCL